MYVLSFLLIRVLSRYRELAADRADALLTGRPSALASALTKVTGYLYKRGTFYPFAPLPGGAGRRDNALELRVRAVLAEDLRIEPDLGRWFPVWGAPGL
ncbi:hypothetical protein GCM10027075_33880 [Streptomyces heilongjiangensis]